ncbi:MAG TPA: hypothetical protein VFY05_10670, partial [Candidatus Angelobacter sp.]|nr:hypothetical protein [Candidatus Angelobacter sp.]
MKRGLIAAIWIFSSLSALAQAPRTSAVNPSQIVAQSQAALTEHNEKEALRLVLGGLADFPQNDELELQLARVLIYQKHDRQAFAKINAVLRRTPDNRDAKLELAQLYGYRDDYKKSDPLYRELLQKNPGDEAAAL